MNINSATNSVLEYTQGSNDSTKDAAQDQVAASNDDQTAQLPQANMNEFTNEFSGRNPLSHSAPTVITESDRSYTTTEAHEEVLIFADGVELQVSETPGHRTEGVSVYVSGDDNDIAGSSGNEHITVGGGAGHIINTLGGDDTVEVYSSTHLNVDTGAGSDVIVVSELTSGSSEAETIRGGAGSDTLTLRNGNGITLEGDSPELDSFQHGDDTFNIENSEYVFMDGGDGNNTYNIDGNTRDFVLQGGNDTDTVNLDIPYDDTLSITVHVDNNRDLTIFDSGTFLGEINDAERVNFSNGTSLVWTGANWDLVEG